MTAQKASVTKCVSFLTPLTKQQTPAGCPPIQFPHHLPGNSVRLSPQDCPPAIDTSHKSRPSELLTDWLQVGVPMSSSLGSNNLLEWLKELRGTLTYLYWFNIMQGSPTPRPRPSPCPWPLRNRAPPPHRRRPVSVTAWTPPPVRPAVAGDSLEG